MGLAPALTTGSQGIQSGMQRLQQTASDVARLNNEPRPGEVRAPVEPAALGERARPGLEQSMVVQIEASHLVKSNARTVEVASDNLGTLLDLKA